MGGKSQKKGSDKETEQGHKHHHRPGKDENVIIKSKPHKDIQTNNLCP